MVNPVLPCKPPQTNKEKEWPYHEYYVGERDKLKRKNGHGRYYWSGAESLEWYDGNLVRDTMHGVGVHRCRHRGAENQDKTYEGHYYNNCKYGYGQMSFPNGRVFSGLYHTDLRWGPGVETHICLRESVGLWKGCELVRLTWKPTGPSVVPDLFSTSMGCNIVNMHRSVLVTNTRTIGEINPALELLKQYGSNPLAAAQKWTKLYPNNCTDKQSQVYHSDVFDRAFYDSNVKETLVPVTTRPKEDDDGSQDISDTYYVWNNNELIVHMMKHCYLHDKQRKRSGPSLTKILNGPRSHFKPAAQHELDCRMLLVASYLGHIINVAQLINDYDVNPNVTDIQGNSAIMYATCGNHPEIIHFLIEAGAQIDNYNDACCTPLGVALINYACARWDIPHNKMLEAILPPPTATVPVPALGISEWIIERDQKNLLRTASNKTLKSMQGPGAKKLRPSQTTIVAKSNKKPDQLQQKDSKPELETQVDDSVGPFTEDKRLYMNLINEYSIVVNDLFTRSSGPKPTPYLFEVNDMVKVLDATLMEEQKKALDKKDLKKEVKDISKISKVAIAAIPEKNLSQDKLDLAKAEHLEQMMTTIEQLLKDGADPGRVQCPQPALFIATVSRCPELIRLLTKYGLHGHEVYPQALGYSSLDIAVSGPLTHENLNLISVLLASGAKANHRLPIHNPMLPDEPPIPGPTLLHVLLEKKNPDIGAEEEIRQQIIELLLEYGCDPIAQYKGCAAMDIAMTKPIDIFDTFIESPHTDLNAVINESNQNILVKMFFLPYCRTIAIAERLQMLENLLLFGADPLLKCKNREELYDNLFVFTKKVLSEINKVKTVAPPVNHDSKKAKTETKGKKEKGKVDTQAPKAKIINIAEELGDYQQAVSLVTNCARLLFIRWLQAKLMKELILIVNKYKHRHWNVILKEYKNGKRCGLWLNPVRCLEIWDVLKSTKKKIYNDKRVLKFVLCIVTYHDKRTKKILRQPVMSFQEKTSIETDVAHFIREHESITTVTSQVFKRPYVMPELTHDNEIEKFNICFECAIPLVDGKIPCGKCKLVDFCSFDCMKENIEKHTCHPCSSYLKKKYFPTPEPSETDIAYAELLI